MGSLVAIELNVGAFPLHVVEKAALLMRPTVDVLVTALTDGGIQVVLVPHSAAEELRFHRNLADCTVQERINAETRDVRAALIVAALGHVPADSDVQER